jgi:hypothetical protein
MYLRGRGEVWGLQVRYAHVSTGSRSESRGKRIDRRGRVAGTSGRISKSTPATRRARTSSP